MIREGDGGGKRIESKWGEKQGGETEVGGEIEGGGERESH